MSLPVVFRRVVAALVACTLLAPPLSAPARAQAPSIQLPALGDVATDEFSPQLERKVGEQIWRQVRADPKYLDDDDTREYINRLGYQLVAASGSPGIDFRFFVVRDPMLNAFALPGGIIGVHSGLVIAAQNESELAGVLGHEIGHVTQRHIARMIARQKDVMAIALGSLLLALLAARAGSSGGELAQAAAIGGQAAALQTQLNFSRENEREADRVGYQTLSDAGFDPRGMETFFGRLQQGTRIYEGATPAYLRTHPLTTERISDMQNRTRDLPFRQHADSLDFKLIQARLRVLQSTTQQGWRDALTYFDEQLRNRTAPSDIAAHYGAALAALKLRQTEPALRHAQSARRLAMAPSVFLDKLVAETRLAAATTPQERDAAVALARDTFERFPLSETAVSSYVAMLIETGRYQAAIDTLRSQAALWRNDAGYHGLMSQAYAALDKRSLQHQSAAEMYVLSGARTAAIQQLELARRANDADFYTMSEIDARLRELQRQVREDQEEERKSRSGARQPEQKPKP